jgi:hypothetical protein
MSKEEIYDSQINPLMAQIIEICQKNNIPFVMSFQLTTDEEDEDGAMFCTSCLIPKGCHEKLVEAKYILYDQQPTMLSMIIKKAD